MWLQEAWKGSSSFLSRRLQQLMESAFYFSLYILVANLWHVCHWWHLRRRESCKPLYKKWGILTMPSAYIYACAVHIHWNVGRYPKQEDQHIHFTRGKDNLRIPPYRLSLTGRSFEVMALKLYNKLPNYIKNNKMVHFCKNLKKYLLTKPYYSVNEFLIEGNQNMLYRCNELSVCEM